MQFDRTAIAISQRTNTELIDLSLVVLRHFWKDLVWYAIFGAIPFAILNWYVTIPLRDYGYLTSFSYGDANAEIGYRILYLLWMAMLVYFEAPLAMSAVTFVLGERAFRIGNDRRKTLSTLWKIKFRLLRVLGMVRGGLLILAVGFFLHGNQSMQRNTSGASGWLLFGLVIIAFVRGFKPFAPEILLLEQTPLKKEPKSAGASRRSYSERSSWLHSSSGDQFVSWFCTSLVAMFLTLSLCLCSLFLVGSVIGYWSWGWWMDVIFFPLILWLIAFWSTIVRFLGYVNTRILGEGWELELKLKAEARRLKDDRSQQHV